MDYKNTALLILSVTSFILLIVIFGQHPPASSQVGLIKRLQDSLAKELKITTAQAHAHEAQANFYKRKSDSLSLNPQIKIKEIYVISEKKIDRAGSNALVRGFDSIFAANGISTK